MIFYHPKCELQHFNCFNGKQPYPLSAPIGFKCHTREGRRMDRRQRGVRGLDAIIPGHELDRQRSNETHYRHKDDRYEWLGGGGVRVLIQL